METFEIQLLEKRYSVTPQDNGTFRIMDREEKLGVIYPEPGENGSEWKTMDELDVDFVSQLGELITEHNL